MTKPNLVNRFHLALLLVSVGFAATAIFKVPEGTGLVMHWDAQGQGDWYWPRDIAFAVVPVLAAIVTAAFAIWSAVTPKGRLEMARHVLEPALSSVLGLCACVQFGLLMLATGSDFDIIRILAFAVAPLLLLLGILLREAERHTYAGLRLPWAMPDDRVWRSAHQVAGWSYIAAALVLAGLAWLQPYPATLLIALPLVLTAPLALARLAKTDAGIRERGE